MPLAAPLILPFAELAGITIAGLSMAAASQKISDFISEMFMIFFTSLIFHYIVMITYLESMSIAYFSQCL